MEDSFPGKLRAAGVVGAGGAGFPAHVKASSKAALVIMNAAECEPLLCKDLEILEHFTPEVLAGMSLMMASVGAAQGIIGIKRKHGGMVKKLSAAAKAAGNIRVHELGDFYPAGDEYCLVYEITGKLIPPGGIPLDIGAVVNNVETFYNMALAEKTPVVDTFLTVCGAVKNPVTLRLPIGTCFAEAIELAGGATAADYAVIDGGPMMGRVETDMSVPVTKTTAGIIVLPKTHPLLLKKSAGRAVYSRIGRSVCDQCSFCTMLCPRYLLGYNIEPHRVMRSLAFGPSGSPALNEYALACCECSLCSLYSCPENLDPRNVCVSAKSDLREQGVGLKNSAIIKKPSCGPHPVREFRKTPVSRLVKRLGLLEYKKHAPLSGAAYSPKKVRIPLSQHAGAPAIPAAASGARVTRGDLIAAPPPDKLGAPVHASISGTIGTVTDKYMEIYA